MGFAQPQKGLVPIGGNWYATPDIPQKPNYSDPFKPILEVSKKGIEINPPIGIDFEPISDGCNIGLQATGFLAYINLPSYQILYHNPSLGCNPPPPPPPEPLDDEPLPFPPPPPNPYHKYIVITMTESIRSTTSGKAIEGYLGEFPEGFQFSSDETKSTKITSLEETAPDEILIGRELIVFPNYRDIYATHVAVWEESRSFTTDYRRYPDSKNYPNISPASTSYSGVCRTYFNANVRNIRKDEILSFSANSTPGIAYDGSEYQFETPSEGNIDSIQAFSVSLRSYSDLLSNPDINKPYKVYGNTLDLIDGINYFAGRVDQQINKPRIIIKELPKGEIVPPPPPPKPKKPPEPPPDDMCCNNQNALIQYLLAKDKQNTQDISALEKYINQLDGAGKEIFNSIARLDIVANVIGFFVSKILKLLLRF
ncbi:hypothetical protein [Anabaena sp. PCC 7108]|uniref:hypothetical protein n=1 Tax=Anabaena sp. PCC 7108 TaxID=163908 RepID=UPI00034C9C5E|nr:hypothetical protein [Anabaena sp. PCC 7108]